MTTPTQSDVTTCHIAIIGTGFKATDFLTPMQVSGRNGQDLNTAWRHGARAYKGITVHGFPNFFMLYGPNTNLAHNSIIFMLESQIRYVLQAASGSCRTGGHEPGSPP